MPISFIEKAETRANPRQHLTREDRLILEAIVWNPNTPGEILERIAEAQQNSLNQYIAQHPNVLASTLEKLVKNKNEEIRLYIARNQKTPEALLEQLAKDENLAILSAIACNPATSGKVLEKLSEEKSSEILKCISRHPNTPEIVLEKLAREENCSYSYNLATNPSTPQKVLELLVRDKKGKVVEGKVAETLAQNPNISKSVVEHLATNVYNHRFLANNEGIPASWLAQLADHTDENVLAMVAQHPNTPVEIIIEKREIFPKFSLAKNPNTPVQILESLVPNPDGKYYANLANNPNASEKLLEKLADCEDNPLFPHRHLLTEHPKTPGITLKKLAKELDSYKNHLRFGIRKNIARHPNTPVEFLEKLAQDSNYSVRIAVAENVNTPEHLRLQIWSQLAEDSDFKIREAVVASIKCPVQILIKLARDRKKGHELIIRTLAKNINIPITFLEELAENQDYIVRRKIVENPITPIYILINMIQQFPKDNYYEIIGNSNMPLRIIAKLTMNYDDNFISQRARQVLNQHIQKNLNYSISIFDL